MKIEKGQIWIISDLDSTEEHTLQIISKSGEIAAAKNKRVILLEFKQKNKQQLLNYVRHGADEIYDYGERSLSNSEVKEECCKKLEEYEPYLILTCYSNHGRELAAQIATKLELGLVAECISIKIKENEDSLVFSRTAINSSTLANIVCVNTNTQMCTIKKDVFSISQEDEQRTGNIISANISPIQETKPNCFREIRIEHLESRKNPDECLNSNIIIGVGRGAIRYMEKIKELASLIHADIGVTRAVVDAGIVNKDYQIGQSGNAI